MAIREYRTRDKSEWGEGPWQDEPDKVQWQDGQTGLACLIVRNRIGAWCGYVGLPPGHPLFELGYDEVHEQRPELDVHGSLTFADHCHEGPEEESICHVPEPGQPDNVWWLGFDCAHSMDICPTILAGDRKRFEETGDPLWDVDSRRHHSWQEYRTVEYVQAEVRKLAGQLARVTAIAAEPDA